MFLSLFFSLIVLLKSYYFKFTRLLSIKITTFLKVKLFVMFRDLRTFLEPLTSKEFNFKLFDRVLSFFSNPLRHNDTSSF